MMNFKQHEYFFPIKKIQDLTAQESTQAIPSLITIRSYKHTNNRVQKARKVYIYLKNGRPDKSFLEIIRYMEWRVLVEMV